MNGISYYHNDFKTENKHTEDRLYRLPRVFKFLAVGRQFLTSYATKSFFQPQQRYTLLKKVVLTFSWKEIYTEKCIHHDVQH